MTHAAQWRQSRAFAHHDNGRFRVLWQFETVLRTPNVSADPCHTYRRVVLHRRKSRVTRTKKSRLSCERVMPQVQKSHVTHKRVVSRMWKSCFTHMKESMSHRCKSPCQTYKQVMSLSHVQTSHVNQVKESCHTHERVVSRMWASRFTYTKESCRTHEKSRIKKSHVQHTTKSCGTGERVVSCIQRSRVAHTKESRHTHERVVSLARKRHCTHVKESGHAWKESQTRIKTTTLSQTRIKTTTFHVPCAPQEFAHNVPGAKKSCHTYERVASHL